MVDKYYLFNTWYDGWSDDIAIIQLRESIGQQIGWMGIAFSSDTSYFSGKVFHKLSYPAVTNPFDSTKIYNGDTLYYNSGNIDIILPNALGVNSPEALGVPGQSGSSLFYTDNSEYYTFGVLSTSNNYKHPQITRNIFYQYKNIIDTYSISTRRLLRRNIIAVKVYPNPANQYVTFEFDNSEQVNHTLTLYDIQGRLVQTIMDITTNKIEMDRRDLTSGLYFFLLSTDKQVRANGKLTIE
ncbi:MAG: T9SS type A sorting domain-containing protein [Flavobacteriales bacterium]|nr:T9SS type A sorting domain-containing protein [Flavobacteriales bacterium]